MPKPLPYNATLLEREDMGPTLAIFRIRPDEMPAPGELWFEPGQYVSLGLNYEDSGEPSSVQRAYSIASEPEERRWLEFYVRCVAPPHSAYPFTHLLWEIGPGDRIHVGRRCTGHFTLNRSVGPGDARIKLFVAAGTGLAPFASMIRSRRRRLPTRSQGRFVLLHGARHAHELGYREEMEPALGEIQGHYLPTVSRPEANPRWTGAKGRVESFLDGEKVEALESRLGLAKGGLAPANAVVYVCGFKGTIAGSLDRLLCHGFVPADRRVRRVLEIPEVSPPSLFFEQYDTDPILDPNDRERIERLKSDLASSR